MPIVVGLPPPVGIFRTRPFAVSAMNRLPAPSTATAFGRLSVNPGVLTADWRPAGVTSTTWLLRTFAMNRLPAPSTARPAGPFNPMTGTAVWIPADVNLTTLLFAESAI